MQGIRREKQHTLAEVGILTRQDGVEGEPVQCGHVAVTENDIIVPLVEPSQCKLTMRCRVHEESITPEEGAQSTDEGWRIVNHQNS